MPVKHRYTRKSIRQARSDAGTALISHDIWRDPDFVGLTEPQRLMFIYLISCPYGSSMPMIVLASRDLLVKAWEESTGRASGQDALSALERKGLVKLDGDFATAIVRRPDLFVDEPTPRMIADWGDSIGAFSQSELVAEAYLEMDAMIRDRWPDLAPVVDAAFCGLSDGPTES